MNRPCQLNQVRTCFIWVLITLSSYLPSWAQLPDGFYNISVSQNWNRPVGFVFDEQGSMYVWEKAGRVYRVRNSERKLILDIHEEVGEWKDHGLMSVALHPNFLQNGWIYLLYDVDRHHLFFHGTTAYNPDTTISEQASIGRLTRYELDITGDFSAIESSRKILLGETLSTGIPVLHNSHGPGTLAFGNDGSLLLSTGDGTTGAIAYAGGGDLGSYAPQAIADGILQAKQDVGAFRAQMIDAYNGKILRIDPVTGDGLASNPFFDTQNPRSAASRVWALGLRNPFRFSVKPGTGSHSISDGDPGILLVGDVGWGNWEELNIVTEKGQNFGWPLYEGYDDLWVYDQLKTANLDAPNPLGGAGACANVYFNFQDLLIEATQDASPFFPNPCNEAIAIPNDIPVFVHSRPAIVWSNTSWNPPARAFTGSFDGDGNPTVIPITDDNTPVLGQDFGGIAVVGSAFSIGNTFPEAYRDKFFLSDHDKWIRIFELNDQFELIEVKSFYTDAGRTVHIAFNPIDGCLYYSRYANNKIEKICFGGNPPPIAVIKTDQDFGPSPLEVQFSALDSYDPDGQPLQFLWDFGNGETSTEEMPTHTFLAASNGPEAFEVFLTVTDSAGASSKVVHTISVNNTPPQVHITSIPDSMRYPITGFTWLPLKAEVVDQEHGETELEYEWQTFFHHNTHFHPEPPDRKIETNVLLAPEGCGFETYYYRIGLTVTDADGLSAYDEVEIYPFCNPTMGLFQSFEANAIENGVGLNWEFKVASGLEKFEVQYAVDGIHFETIASIPHENGKTQYSYTHLNPIDGLNHYRIKALQSDALFDYSTSQAVLYPAPPPVLLFPNPATELIQVRIEGFTGLVEFTCMDLVGKQWLHTSFELENTTVFPVSVSNLPEGIYLYRVRFNGNQYAGKIQVVKE